MIRPLVALVLLGFACPAMAQTQVDLRIFVPGNMSFGTWTEERKKDSEIAVAYSFWIEGFVTAAELYNPRLAPAAKQIDTDAMNGWVDNWCAAHPLSKIADAANFLTEAIYQQHPAAK